MKCSGSSSKLKPKYITDEKLFRKIDDTERYSCIGCDKTYKLNVTRMVEHVVECVKTDLKVRDIVKSKANHDGTDLNKAMADAETRKNETASSSFAGSEVSNDETENEFQRVHLNSGVNNSASSSGDGDTATPVPNLKKQA